MTVKLPPRMTAVYQTGTVTRAGQSDSGDGRPRDAHDHCETPLRTEGRVQVLICVCLDLNTC